MRLLTFVVAMLCLVCFVGCLSTGPKIQWSRNIAVFAASKDAKLNDDNIYSVGETSPLIESARDVASQEEADKYTQAVLEWGKPQQIQKIVIKADVGALEVFDIQYRNEEGKWETLRSVKDHIKEVYKYQRKEPIITRELRLKVPRQWDSRLIRGQKRSTRTETGAPSGSFKKIREIEVYYALPAEEPAVAQ